MDKNSERLLQHLFAETDSSVYAVLDGAAIPNLLDMFEEHEPFRVCLFRGVHDPELAETAPYLVRLEADAPFAEWLLTEGLEKHWGIFVVVPERTSFVDLRKHFRDMLRVHLPDGEVVHFRYYDPRVCKDFLPDCGQKQLRAFFGPVTRYFAEKKIKGEVPSELIEYSLERGALRQTPVSLVVKY